ncbi:hypothetical protein NUW54_g11308 [Trametes sanguinea]|uniref:Uncharacterized protein n=1 Tax=Trametes sanguinea TaxID=158606 RepID=A0ACC1NG81_9APHY|nr:hypothetical protein NUW54_g11308 [Trametes sanguinea]
MSRSASKSPLTDHVHRSSESGGGRLGGKGNGRGSTGIVMERAGSGISDTVGIGLYASATSYLSSQTTPRASGPSRSLQTSHMQTSSSRVSFVRPFSINFDPDLERDHSGWPLRRDLVRARRQGAQAPLRPRIRGGHRRPLAVRHHRLRQPAWQADVQARVSAPLRLSLGASTTRRDWMTFRKHLNLELETLDLSARPKRQVC